MEKEGKWNAEERGDGKWKLDLNHQLQRVPSYNGIRKEVFLIHEHRCVLIDLAMIHEWVFSDCKFK